MAIGNMDPYRALREAGVSEERASEAAKSVAGHMPRFWFMLGTLAALTALILGVLGMQWQLLDRLAQFEARVDVRLAGIESHLDSLQTSLDGFGTRLEAVEGALTAIEGRLPPP